MEHGHILTIDITATVPRSWDQYLAEANGISRWWQWRGSSEPFVGPLAYPKAKRSQGSGCLARFARVRREGAHEAGAAVALQSRQRADGRGCDGIRAKPPCSPAGCWLGPDLGHAPPRQRWIQSRTMGVLVGSNIAFLSSRRLGAGHGGVSSRSIRLGTRQTGNQRYVEASGHNDGDD